MKKILFINVLFFMALLSCNETKKNDTINKPIVSEQEPEKEAKSHEGNTLNNIWTHDIKLDNGSKWDANIETTQGVNAMLDHINKTNPNTVEDYLALGNKLNDEKNMVVKECTMKGPSHDNLHIFLHPLIEKIDHLLKTSSIEEGSEITTSIKENLEAYATYFK